MHPLEEALNSVWRDDVPPPITSPDRSVGWRRIGGSPPDAIASSVSATIRAATGIADHRIVATTTASRIAWATRFVVVVSLVSGRVPLTAPGSLTVDDACERVSMRLGSFACLDTDAVSEHPDATVVRGHDALWQLLHDSFTDPVIAPLIRSITRSSRMSPRALWGMVSSAWASGISEAGGAHPLAPSIVDRTRRMMELHPGLSSTAPVFHGSPAEPKHWRGACCLWYRVPDETYCENCPLLPDGKRALAEARRGRADR